MFPAAFWAEDEYVVTFLLNAKGETNGADRPVLPGNFNLIFKFRRGGELELRRVAKAAQCILMKD